MSQLAQKKILLGISGGIAAYKSALLVRQLRAQGAQVRVVMTQGAQAFIQPLTLQALSGHPVHLTLLDPAAEAGMGHIELSRWPDIIVLAPASANLLARLAAGMADDLLTTLVLAAQVPTFVAPAMNQQMWQAPVTARNVAELQRLNAHWHWLGPDSGEQACGEVGPGRMLEPEHIVAALVASQARPLAGRKIVLTAGPTREPIDPVRFLSNHSSGKMGYALAQACQQLGAEVVLVSGPVALPPPPGVRVLPVQTAKDMLAAVTAELTACYAFFAVAAVADYCVADVATQKIKKVEHGQQSLQLQLQTNPDILATVAAHSQRPTWVFGFAAETDNLLPYARAKRVRKGADFMLANAVGQPGSGMDADNNALVLLGETLEHHFALQSKPQLASELLSYLCHHLFKSDL